MSPAQHCDEILKLIDDVLDQSDTPELIAVTEPRVRRPEDRRVTPAA